MFFLVVIVLLVVVVILNVVGISVSYYIIIGGVVWLNIFWVVVLFVGSVVFFVYNIVMVVFVFLGWC